MISISLTPRHAAALLAAVTLTACASAGSRSASSTVAYTHPCASGSALQVDNRSGEAIRVVGAKTGDPNKGVTTVLMSVAPDQKVVVPGAHAELSRIYAEPIDNSTLPNNAPRSVRNVDFRCIPDSVAFGS